MYQQLAIVAYAVVIFLTLRDIRIFRRTHLLSYRKGALKGLLASSVVLLGVFVVGTNSDLGLLFVLIGLYINRKGVRESVFKDAVAMDRLLGKTDYHGSNKKETIKMKDTDVYEYLIGVARKGCDVQSIGLDLHDPKERQKLRKRKIIVTYGDVLVNFGKTRNDKKSLDELFKILDEINEKAKPILLSALVVNQVDFIPSTPFFEKWLKLDTNNTTKNELINAWEGELNNIWQHYCK